MCRLTRPVGLCPSTLRRMRTVRPRLRCRGLFVDKNYTQHFLDVMHETELINVGSYLMCIKANRKYQDLKRR